MNPHPKLLLSPKQMALFLVSLSFPSPQNWFGNGLCLEEYICVSVFCVFTARYLYMSSVHYTQPCVLCLLCAGIYTLNLHCQVLSCTQTEASWLCGESASCSDLCKTVNPGLGWLSLAPTSLLAQC